MITTDWPLIRCVKGIKLSRVGAVVNRQGVTGNTPAVTHGII